MLRILKILKGLLGIRYEYYNKFIVIVCDL